MVSSLHHICVMFIWLNHVFINLSSHRSVGEEVHEAASTEDTSTPKSFEAVTSVSSVDECIGGCDVISLSDIVPQTSSCY